MEQDVHDFGDGLVFEHSGCLVRLPVEVLTVIENEFLPRDFGGDLYQYLSVLITLHAELAEGEPSFETLRLLRQHRAFLLASHGQASLNRLELSLGIRGDDLRHECFRRALSGVTLGSVTAASEYMSAYLSTSAMDAKRDLEVRSGIRCWTLRWRESVERMHCIPDRIDPNAVGEAAPPHDKKQPWWKRLFGESSDWLQGAS